MINHRYGITVARVRILLFVFVSKYEGSIVVCQAAVISSDCNNFDISISRSSSTTSMVCIGSIDMPFRFLSCLDLSLAFFTLLRVFHLAFCHQALHCKGQFLSFQIASEQTICLPTNWSCLVGHCLLYPSYVFYHDSHLRWLCCQSAQDANTNHVVMIIFPAHMDEHYTKRALHIKKDVHGVGIHTAFIYLKVWRIVFLE